MFNWEKRWVHDIKKLENTTIPSLHDRGQPLPAFSGLPL